MKKTGGGSMIAALLLTCVFAVSMLLTLVLGARVYQGVQARVAESAAQRVGLSYITAKVHAADTMGGVEAGSFGGLDAVLINQDIEGMPYVTALYVTDGVLRELFCENLEDFLPEDGEAIQPAQALSVQQAGSLLTLTLTEPDGTAQAAQIHLRSEG